MTRTTARYPWKTFLILVAAAVATAPLALPYFTGLQASAPHPEPITTSTARLAALALVRTAIWIVPATALGLLLARRIGLGAPYLECRLDGAAPPTAPLRSIVGPALGWATATALLAFAIDTLFVDALGVTTPAPEIHARIGVAWWRSGLASLWAPFAEEIVDRLFLLSFVAWVLIRLFRLTPGGRGRALALAIANLATALFFGWYHIGNERLFADPVPTLVAWRTVLIVLPVGLAFGWLYIRRGLEAAILSHFAIDVIVHVLRPIAEGWLRG